jgi:hypothetical protein
MNSRALLPGDRIAFVLVGLFLLSTIFGAGVGGSSARAPTADHPGVEVSPRVDLETYGSRTASDVTPLVGENFSVSFNESGLPTGMSWSVTFNGSLNTSTGSIVGFSAPNGTYPFVVGATPGFVPDLTRGNVSVRNQSVSENLTFTPFTFALTFVENGLPGASNWGLTLNDTPHTTSTAQISVPEPNGTYVYEILAPTGFTASPANGSVLVASGAPTVVINFSAVLYPVVISQVGLIGINWSVNFSGDLAVSNGTELTFLEPNGSYSYAVGSVPGFHASPTSGFVSVAGAPVTLNITFTVNPVGTFPLSFNETGLTPGTTWMVNLTIAHGSSVGSTIVFLKTNGTYRYTVGDVSGYTSSPSSGSATVAGTLTFVNITFAPILYPVNFSELGLPAGTNWSVELGDTLQSSLTPTLEFEEANGSVPFAAESVPGFHAVPLNGTVNISGAAASVSVVFTAVNYTVAFTETGLPSGTNWSVKLGSHTVRGDGTGLSRSEPNGTIAFSLGSVIGFQAIPSSGNLTVNGSAVVEAIAFSSVDFTVTFAETGLPNGSSWSVTLASDTQGGTGATIGFVEPNGTYAYEVPTVPGFTVVPSSGNLTVSGANVRQSLSYTPLPPGLYALTFMESGLPTGQIWSVDLAGTVENSSTDQIVFAEKNDTYPFSVGEISGYHAVPSSGAVMVAGADKDVSITFTPQAPPQFGVTFTETGLPSGTNWSVDLNGSLVQGTTPSLSTTDPNGSYSFEVTAVYGYNTSNASGMVVVAGQAVSETVPFTANPLLRNVVTFDESGLPSDTNWSATVDGTTGFSTGADLTLANLPAGPDEFSVRAPGYSALPASGNVSVGSGPVTITVTFSLAGPAHGAGTTGSLSVPTLAFLGAMGVVVVAAVVIAVGTRNGRREAE